MNNVPELRFPEFGNVWTIKKLKETTEYTKGFAFKSQEYQTTGTRIIRVSDLAKDKIKTENDKVFISENKSHLYDKYIINKGNIIITTVGSKPEMLESAVGRGIYVNNNGEGLLNQNLLKLENLDLVNNKFLSCYINSPKYIYHIISIQRGNANQSNITVKDFLNFKVAIPILKEQKKIADFLSAVDNKITALRRKHELLERYKRGIMQKIFPSAGSGQAPEIRFASTGSAEVNSKNSEHAQSKVAEPAEAFPDWEEKKLGDCLEIGSGRDYKHLHEGNIPVYGTGGLMLHVDDYLYDGESVCIGRKGTIDKPVFLTGQFWTVDTLFYTHKFKKNIPKFFYYIFLLINWKKYNEASGVPSLSKKTIEKIKRNIPTPKEQQKIADFLSAIDQKIDAVSQQIEQTEQFKKGLLQKMFV